MDLKPDIPKHLLQDPDVQNQIAAILINPDVCQSIKSKREPQFQCMRAKKVGDLCGVHDRTKNVTRVAQLIALINAIKKPGPIKVPSIIKEYPIKEYQYPELVNLSSENLNPLRLQLSLKRYDLIDSGKTSDFATQVEKLKQFLKPVYDKALAASLGPGTIKDCQNDSDFFILDKLDEIPAHFFFSFCETAPQVVKETETTTPAATAAPQAATGPENKRIYGCDFRSFQQYITSLKTESTEPLVITNPYNRQNLAPETIDDYHRKLLFLKQYHSQEALNFPELELTPEEKLRFKVLDVFQIIYHYDYPVDHLWFLNLNKEQLLKYYQRLEDIWNFRLGLTKQDKQLIVPNNPNLFNSQERASLRHQNLFTIQNRMIHHLESLVTQGQSLADRKNGAMYLLIGLVEVCPQAAQNLPYLAYSAGIAV